MTSVLHRLFKLKHNFWI